MPGAPSTWIHGTNRQGAHRRWTTTPSCERRGRWLRAQSRSLPARGARASAGDVASPSGRSTRWSPAPTRFGWHSSLQSPSALLGAFLLGRASLRGGARLFRALLRGLLLFSRTLLGRRLFDRTLLGRRLFDRTLLGRRL